MKQPAAFMASPTAADRTNCQRLAVVCRDKNEQRASSRHLRNTGLLNGVDMPLPLRWYEV